MIQHKLSYRLVRYIILHHELYSNSLLCLGDNTPKNQYVASVYLECQAMESFTWKFVVVQDLRILNTVSGAVMS